MIRDFWISINEKYQRNKTVIWFIVMAVTLFIIVTRNMDKMASSTRGSSVNSTTSGSVSNDEKIDEIVSKTEDNYEQIKEQMQDVNITEEDCIKLFVKLCNSGKVDSAYQCLTNECKEELYPTKQDFIDEYYSVIFKTSKNYEITEVKNDTYKVKYTNDVISTGNETSSNSSVIDYITIKNGKVSISNFIGKQSINITSIAPYFTIYIDEKLVYMDHEIYKVRAKNNTRADIYLNDADNSNLYLKDSYNNVYSIDTSSMYDSDYLITSKTEKSVDLTFNINYAENTQITEMSLGTMKIENKEYLDSTSEVVNPQTGNREYEKVKTNYPEQYSWNIKFTE
ncbi:MAG: hypothetical protein IJH12_01795 [Clostridia bacterium]|nr:hypothetical protein [Clostridia bacterium]